MPAPVEKNNDCTLNTPVTRPYGGGGRLGGFEKCNKIIEKFRGRGTRRGQGEVPVRKPRNGVANRAHRYRGRGEISEFLRFDKFEIQFRAGNVTAEGAEGAEGITTAVKSQCGRCGRCGTGSRTGQTKSAERRTWRGTADGAPIFGHVQNFRDFGGLWRACGASGALIGQMRTQTAHMRTQTARILGADGAELGQK